VRDANELCRTISHPPDWQGVKRLLIWESGGRDMWPCWTLKPTDGDISWYDFGDVWQHKGLMHLHLAWHWSPFFFKTCHSLVSQGWQVSGRKWRFGVAVLPPVLHTIGSQDTPLSCVSTSVFQRPPKGQQTQRERLLLSVATCLCLPAAPHLFEVYSC
jgi:hypothetical protein